MKLSPRHLDVLRLASAGHTYPEIAEQLSVSKGTVRSYVSALLVTLDARSMTHAVHIAHCQGILDGQTAEWSDAVAVVRQAFAMGYRIALSPTPNESPGQRLVDMACSGQLDSWT